MSASLAQVQAQLVIQCPSCSTRFALEATSLESIEFPRFHCSKCDLVFTMEEAQSSRIINVAAEKSREQAIFAQQEVTRETIVVNSHFEFPQPNITRNVFGPSIIPPMAAPQQKNHKQSFGYLNPHLSAEQSTAQVPKVMRTAGGLGAWDGKEHARLNQDDAGSGDLQTDHQISFSSNIFSIADFSRLSKLSSIAFYSLPFLVCLLGITIASVYFVKSPSSADTFMAMLMPTQPEPPPSSLFISRSNFKEVTLTNGEKIMLVAGEVLNNSDQSFHDILIEAQLFAVNGELLERKVLNAASNLADTKLQTLDRDIIAKLEGSLNSAAITLQPDGRRKFVVPFGSNPAAKSYSARVYSVRKE